MINHSALKLLAPETLPTVGPGADPITGTWEEVGLDDFVTSEESASGTDEALEPIEPE